MLPPFSPPLFSCSKDFMCALLGVFLSLACCRVGADEPKAPAKTGDPVEDGIGVYLKMLDLSPARPGERLPAQEDYRCVKGAGEGVPAGLDILWLRTFGKCRMPRENGFVFLWHDEKFLYVGAVMEDRNVFNTARAKNDAPHSKGDVLELFFQPAGDAYFELHAAPNGATLESLFPKAGCFENNALGRSHFFKSGMSSRSGKFILPSGVTGWWARMKIPFTRLKSSPERLGEAKFTAARFNYNADWGKVPETSTTSSIPDGVHPHRPDRWLSFLTK